MYFFLKDVVIDMVIRIHTVLILVTSVLYCEMGQTCVDKRLIIRLDRGTVFDLGTHVDTKFYVFVK